MAATFQATLGGGLGTSVSTLLPRPPPIQEQALEDLKFVSVADIPRQANTAIAATNTNAIVGTIKVMGMPETLRQAAEQKKE